MDNQVIQPDNPAKPPAKVINWKDKAEVAKYHREYRRKWRHRRAGHSGEEQFMKDKYDKRANNGDARRFTQYGAKAGPQPKWLKNLSRNKSTTYLEQCDAIK